MWNILRNIYILFVSFSLLICLWIIYESEQELIEKNIILQTESNYRWLMLLDTHYLYREMIYENKRKEMVKVDITAYTARKEECDETPWFTAIMEKPVPGGTIAVSRDLKYLLGRKVYIPGYGIRRVNDLMNERYSKRVDILVASVGEAYRHGVKKGKLVIID